VKSLNYNGTGRAQLLKLSTNGKGYLIVCLTIDKKKKYYMTHRLVGKAFLKNPLDLPYINHRDEIKTNNHIDNLEFCTHQYNSSYGTAPSRIAKARSIPIIGVNILTKEFISFESATKASKYGFHAGHINSCCRGKGKTHKGYKWYYKDDYLIEKIVREEKENDNNS